MSCLSVQIASSTEFPLWSSFSELPLSLSCFYHWVASPIELLLPLSYLSGQVASLVKFLWVISPHWVTYPTESSLQLSCLSGQVSLSLLSHQVTSHIELPLLIELPLPTELPLPLSHLSSWIASLVKFLLVASHTELPLTLSYLSNQVFLTKLPLTQSYLSLYWVTSPIWVTSLIESSLQLSYLSCQVSLICLYSWLPLQLSYLSPLSYLYPLTWISHWVASAAELPLPI